MISRLSVSEGFVLVFWSRGPTHWFSSKHALAGMHLQSTGGGHWCILFQYPLVGTVFLMKVISSDIQQKIVLLCSLISGAGSSHHSSVSHHRWANTHPYFLPSFHQILAFSLCLNCLLSKLHINPVIYLRHVAGFRNSKFINPVKWIHIDLLIYDLTLFLPFLDLSLKCCHMTLKCFGVYWEAQQKTGAKLCCTQLVSLFLC